MIGVNALKNLRVPVPVDPDDPNAGQRDMTGDHILSHFLRIGHDLAKLRAATEYQEDVSYSRRSWDAPCPGGLGANPIQSDPVPQGDTWEIHRITFFFPDSAAVSSTSYFARACTNGKFPDQVIGMAEPPSNDSGNGVLMLRLYQPLVLHPGEFIYADVGATVANALAFMNVWYKSVHVPVVYKEIV